MKLTTDVTLEVELQGAYRPAVRGWQQSDGVYQPGEGPAIDGLRVMLIRGAERIDITAMLTDDKLRDLEEDGLELCALNG